MAIVSSSACSKHPQYGSTHVDIQPGGTLHVEVLTPRLKIVSVNGREYEDALIALYGSKTVNALVGDGGTLSAQAVKEKIAKWNQRWAQNNPFAGYVILDRDTDKFIGQVIIKPLKDKEKEKDANGKHPFVPGVGEIGYLSMDTQWGKKFGQEYTHAILDHLVPALIRDGYTLAGHEVKVVIATARTDNDRSNAILRKLMEHTGTRPRYNGMREWYERKYS